MSGDFSRITFDPSKQYSQVLMQQGRVQIDADWNEAAAIAAHQNAAQLVDVIGPLGAKGDAFRIHLTGDPGSADFRIDPGRCYVYGTVAELDAPTRVRCTVTAGTPTVTVAAWIVDNQAFARQQQVMLFDADGAPVANENGEPIRFLVEQIDSTTQVLTLDQAVNDGGACQLARLVTYQFQPYYPSPPMSFAGDHGTRVYVAYLDVWRRTVTALEDPTIADAALGGADTAVRTQAIWQVKLARVAGGGAPESLAEWTALMQTNGLPRGLMSAQRQSPAAAPVQNQLYRVEIQSGNLPSSYNALTNHTVISAVPGGDQIVVATEQDAPGWMIGQTIRLVGTTTGGASPQGLTTSIIAVTDDVPTNGQTTLTLDATLPTGTWEWSLQRLVTPLSVLSMPAADQVVVGTPADNVEWDGGQTVLLLGAAESGTITANVLAQIMAVQAGSDADTFVLTLDTSVSAGDLTWTLQRVVTVKWARDNASIARQIVGVGTNEITLQDLGSRSVGSFDTCRWVELTTPERQLQGQSGLLVGVKGVNGDRLTLATVPAIVQPGWIAQRWDGGYCTLDGLVAGPAGSAGNGSVALEDGIEVSFSGGIHTTGDFWQIAARANTQAIEWPADDQGPLPQPPAGVEHAYLPLRLITIEHDVWKDEPRWPLSDYRPPIGDLINFLDKRGDTMSGTLMLAPTNASDPSLTANSVVYVGTNSVPVPMPNWYEDDLVEPAINLVDNGTTMIWTENPEQMFDGSFMLLQPPAPDGSSGPRLRFFAPNVLSDGQQITPPATIDFSTATPSGSEGDPTARISLLGQQNITLQIASNVTENKSGDHFLVSIVGDLWVQGTIYGTAPSATTPPPAEQPPPPYARSLAAQLAAENAEALRTTAALTDAVEADAPAEAEALEAAPQDPLDELRERVAILTGTVETQAETIAGLTEALAQLSDRVRALEEGP